VLRQYGSFLLNLLNDASGQTVLHQADQLERVRKTKTRSAAHTNIEDEIFDEDTAVISITCANDKQFGAITSANMGACNMFGCSVGDLVGAPVSTIIPAPFNSMHDGFLHTFLRADRASLFMNRPQHVFATRRNGTIFPIVLRLRQLSGGLQGSAFLAVISEKKVAPSDHFLLYDTASSRVHAVSAGCAALLGIDAATLNDPLNPVSVKDVLPAALSATNEDTDGSLNHKGKGLF